jgi:hypothetical protein
MATWNFLLCMVLGVVFIVLAFALSMSPGARIAIGAIGLVMGLVGTLAFKQQSRQ